jgi:hypothetical protein
VRRFGRFSHLLVSHAHLFSERNSLKGVVVSVH